MFAQDCLGAPLRKAALKLYLQPISAKFAVPISRKPDLRVNA
jgi:hypothetical protein